MTRIVAVTLLLALLAVRPTGARTLAGVDLPDTVAVEGTTLRLNGMGLRQATPLRIKAYVAGLYLETPSHDPATVIDSHQLKRVTMSFLRDIDRGRLSSGWSDALHKAGADAQSVSQFAGFIHDVKKGDTMSFTARPGTGVEVAANGQKVGTVAGDAFTRTLFTMWFGAKPADENLKRGMLGT